MPPLSMMTPPPRMHGFEQTQRNVSHVVEKRASQNCGELRVTRKDIGGIENEQMDFMDELILIFESK